MLNLDLINDQVQNFVSSLVGPYPSLKVRANFIETEGIEVSIFHQERMFASEKDLKYVLWIDAEQIRILKWDLTEDIWKQGTEFTSLTDFCFVFSLLLYRVYSAEYDMDFIDFLTAVLGSPVQDWKQFLEVVLSNSDIKSAALGDAVVFDNNSIAHSGNNLTLEGVINYDLTVETQDELFLGIGILLTVYDFKKYQEQAENKEVEEISNYFGQIGFFPVNLELKALLGYKPDIEDELSSLEDSLGGGGDSMGFPSTSPEDTFEDTIASLPEEAPADEVPLEEGSTEPLPEGGNEGESIEALAEDLLQEDTGEEPA